MTPGGLFAFLADSVHRVCHCGRMNNNAKLWVDTLRSGKYKQTDNTLTKLDEDGNVEACCCLGVACELAVQAGVDITRLTTHPGGGDGEEDIIRYEAAYQWDNGTQDAVLPEPVREWLGLKTFGGEYVMHDEEFDDEISTSLAEQNDNGATFEEIAQIIESEPEGLFGPSAYGKA